jgi:CheY-like chemotaxis protein
MVFDDEQALTRLMKAMLERRGFTVTTFSDSRQALEAFLAAPMDFDMVVTDQTMPGITGDELARRMIARRADLPILLCSGYSERIDAATATELGVRRVLAKPVAMATLLQAITEATQPRAG